MRTVIIFTLALIIQGCSLFDIIKPQDDQVQIHPELPRPIKPTNVDWVIRTEDNNVLVATSYDEFLTLLENQNDIVRYIDQLVNTVCFYRQDLEESFCEEPSKE